MDQIRRRAPGRWLLAVPVLTGAAGGALPGVGQLVALAATLLAVALLWRAGRRATGGGRGWTLMAAAVVSSAVSSAVVGFPDAGAARDPFTAFAFLPAVVLAVAGVLGLLTWSQLRRGGARLVTETALFFSAAMVLAQVLVVGPVLERATLDTTGRVALELSCLGTAALLSALLVLVSVSPGRRVTGALLLLATTTVAVGRYVTLVADGALSALGGWVPACQITALLLVALAVLRDGGPGTDRQPARTRRSTLGLAGQLLPHLVMVVSALLFVGTAVLGARLTPVAAAAVLTGLLLTALHRAVTARDEARVATTVHRSEAYFRSLVRSSSDAVLILDGDLRVTWAAPTLVSGVADAGTELVGARLPDVVHEDDEDAVAAWLTGAGDGAGPSGLLTFRLPAPRGRWSVLETGVSDLRADDDVQALVLHCRDVTARLDREDQLHSIAFTDPLTGLPNRAAQLVALSSRLGALNDRADAELVALAADGPLPAMAPVEGASLLLLELQGLHESRENAGGDVVDLAVVEIGRRLRSTLRSEDQLARVGGEVFSVLAIGTRADVDRVAARCLSVIEQPLATDSGLVDLTAAVGLVPLSAGLSERDALDRADLALRDARAAAPGTVRRYSEELGAARDRQEQLRRDLVGARERGELALAWQPIVALADHRVTGVEASLRWRHPVLGDVPPEEFLPVAARAGLDVELQRWVLRESTIAAVGLPGQQESPLKLGVDVSVQHLASGTLVGDVSAALHDSGLPPEQLVVEICESAVAGGGEHVAADVAALRLMGVHLALDDFGSGHASLPQLSRLPVDVIKLDRSFLSRVDRDAYTRAVCESVVGIGAALNVDVVAVGVETTGQLAVLESIGCGFAQGFLLSRPVSLVALHELLEQGAGRLWPGIPGRV